MKFLTFTLGDGARLGAPLDGGDVLDLTALLRQVLGAQAAVPTDVAALIEAGVSALETVKALLADTSTHAAHTVPAAQVRILAPIPKPGKNVFCVGRNYTRDRQACRPPCSSSLVASIQSPSWAR